MKFNLKNSAQLLVVLFSATCFKYFYATATVNDLRWILAPTTTLVTLVNGTQFAFEANSGYLSKDHTFLIAASCAGVNFFITAFLMLALMQIWQAREKARWRLVPLALIAAYVTTIIANTVRIATAMALLKTSFAAGWLTARQIHRVEGIYVYFGFLLLLYALNERLGGWQEREKRRSLVFPLVVYYCTTLAIPLLNGAYRQQQFWVHGVFVLVAPPLLLVPFAVYRKVRSVQIRRRNYFANSQVPRITDAIISSGP